MKYLLDQLTGIMQTLATPAVQAHLIPAQHIAKKYPRLPVQQRIERQYGYCEHPDFETVTDQTCQYNLKPMRSASQALDSLLHSGEMVINDNAAIVYAYYYAVLQCMIEVHGKEKGCERFDILYGSKTQLVPKERRLKIAQAGVMMGTRHLAGNTFGVPFDFQPLAFMFKIERFTDATELKAKVTPGSIVQYRGDIDAYREKHLAGSGFEFSCIVTSTNPFTVRTLPCDKDCSETDLRDYFNDCLAASPSAESLELMKNKSFIEQLSKNLGYVPNASMTFVLRAEVFNASKLMYLLKAPLDQVIAAYDVKVRFEEENKGPSGVDGFMDLLVHLDKFLSI